MPVILENKINTDTALQIKRKEDRKKPLVILVGLRVVHSLYLLDTYDTKHRLSILFLPNFVTVNGFLKIFIIDYYLGNQEEVCDVPR